MGPVENRCTHECEACQRARFAAEEEAKAQRAKRTAARDGFVSALSIAMIFADQAGEYEARRAVEKLYYEFAPELPPI